MSNLPYKVGGNYLLSSVVKKMKDRAQSFGGGEDYFTVVTLPVEGVSYRVTFMKNGESPQGVVVRCILIAEVSNV